MGFVYIYRSGDRDIFKVGKATNLAKRKAALVTGNPEPLTEFDIIETDYASQCETYMHHRLRTKRSTRSEATEFFEVDPDELRTLIADARHYAEEVLPMMEEAERLSEQPCEDRLLPPTDDVLEAYSALVHVREQYDTLGFQKDHLEARLKVTIGNASGIERVAEWKNVMQLRLNGDLLKAERPDIFAAYQRTSSFRRFALL